MINIELIKTTDTVQLPERATSGSAGLDLRANIQEKELLKPSQCCTIRTGIKLNFSNHPRLVGLILPRSSLGIKYGIILSNSVGVIDSDYQGEIMVDLWNTSNKCYTIRPQEKIAQILFFSHQLIDFTIVSKFSKKEITDRGDNGFGSTGRL